MSKMDTGNDEVFTAKLDIQMASTAMYERLLDLYAGTRVVVSAMGASGIGKTAIPMQVAARRGAPYIALFGPTMSVEDFHIPTTAKDTRQYYDRRIPRKFQAVIEYVERLRKENGGEFPDGKNPIIAIEELNRTTDKHVTRAFFTLIGDRVIGDTHLDPAIQLVTTMNPSGGGMNVNEFERDPAMRRRLLLVGVTASYGDFLRHAKKAKFHGKVISHVEAQPSHFYDAGAAQAGKAFACPAGWEAISTMCYALERHKVTLTSAEARASFAGAIGLTAAEVFLEFLQDATVVITPDEVLQHYSATSSVRTRFKKSVQGDRLDKVSSLTMGVAMKLFADPKRKMESVGKQLALFMEDLPEEVMISFIRELNEQSKAATDGQRAMLALNAMMAKEPYFQKAVERLQRAKKKGEEEAAKSGV